VKEKQDVWDCDFLVGYRGSDMPGRSGLPAHDCKIECIDNSSEIDPEYPLFQGPFVAWPDR
jgi:hypothetical protein